MILTPEQRDDINRQTVVGVDWDEGVNRGRIDLEAGYTVCAYVDRDGHLNLFVAHNDGTAVEDTGDGEGRIDEEWACRLTSDGIEAAYEQHGKDADYDRYPETGYADLEELDDR